jgi:hypothetical protein
MTGGRPGEIGGLRIGWCKAQPGQLVATNHQGLGQHEIVVHDDADGNQHEPASRQLVPARPTPPGERDRGQ